MKKFIRFIFILFYLLFMLVIYLSTVDNYSVIYDMDSAIPQGSLSNNGSDSGKVFAGLILFIIVLIQGIFVYFDKSKKWKWIAGIMAAFALIFFLLR
ncbi:hypothetical protein [Erwinia mallotivora]|uniref:Uncharacterized protein n=1 Tax=Erwinia mallotivora TaxID=69222 RepID=A0A014M9M1_9GAMM|nr:hypothetical protein [Erwinia mallotivora]EXU74764.1 hypothetical protein BG55_13495 [Erwinia mallotivora]